MRSIRVPGGPKGFLAVLVACFLFLVAAHAQDEPRLISLKPAYDAGIQLERHSTLTLDLDVKLLLETPEGNNVYQTDFEMGQVVTARDDVLESLDGTPVRVRRFYEAHRRKLREPGEPEVSEEDTSLHRRTLVISLTANGVRVEKADPTAPIEPEELEGILPTDPFEGFLPREPVAVGAEWLVEGEAFEALYGKPGKVTCRLAALSREKLDEGTEIELAEVEIQLRTTLGAGEMDVEAEMKGKLRFDVGAGRMHALLLEGTATGKSVEKEDQATLTVETRGPVRLEKTVRRIEPTEKK